MGHFGVHAAVIGGESVGGGLRRYCPTDPRMRVVQPYILKARLIFTAIANAELTMHGLVVSEPLVSFKVELSTGSVLAP